MELKPLSVFIITTAVTAERADSRSYIGAYLPILVETCTDLFVAVTYEKTQP